MMIFALFSPFYGFIVLIMSMAEFTKKVFFQPKSKALTLIRGEK
ncbi:hypothetical protein STRDD04_00639 [Streptococcus sp. DD04]|uniref:Uncharacterized protein n=1 Tax=Streptococcus sinensis TaxID=176090 RepID=A0A0A0DIP8_9STRE|nr:hypothetical protein SSIN_0451 [Streptococcus sinensis]KXT66094.1 hypothetical protein STRDD04_00639 [Streptococcus sp. DD04]